MEPWRCAGRGLTCLRGKCAPIRLCWVSPEQNPCLSDRRRHLRGKKRSPLNFYSERCFAEPGGKCIPLSSHQTRVIKRSGRAPPLQTGTHFPLLKNREWSSLVKQMSDAAGVLKMTNKSLQVIRTINTHRRGLEKRKITSASCWSPTGVWASGLLQRKQLWRVPGSCAASSRMSGSYPRCVDHPYKTGDWTKWWGVCLRASCPLGPARPPGYGSSSSSCTLRQKEHADWKDHTLAWAKVCSDLLVQKYEYEPTMPMTSELESLHANGGQWGNGHLTSRGMAAICTRHMQPPATLTHSWAAWHHLNRNEWNLAVL